MINMYILKKESLIFLSLIFTNFGCESKRDAIGADNEIIVICSDVDKDNVESFLTLFSMIAYILLNQNRFMF